MKYTREVLCTCMCMCFFVPPVCARVVRVFLASSFALSFL